MKKLSFGFALALICIFIFSCEDKSIVNPQNDEFKITRISSQSGFEGSAITLYGKNLKSSSFAAIEIGGYQAKIISLTDDSLVILVPQLPVGSHKFEILSKANKIMFLTDFDINLNHDFKINNISSTTGYVNSLVVLYGENLDNSSTMTVKFGDQQAEILAKTKDSIIVKVPKLTNGLYDINIKTILKSFVYSQKYQIIPIDFSLFKNFSIFGGEFQVEYNTLHRWKERIEENSGNYTEYEQHFYFSAHNNEPIFFQSNNGNTYKIIEKTSTDSKSINNEIVFTHNATTHTISSIKVNCYECTIENHSDNRNENSRTMKLTLNDLNYSIDKTGKKLKIELKGKEEITKKLLSFDHVLFFGYSCDKLNEYDNYTLTVKRFLWTNNNGTINIEFSM